MSGMVVGSKTDETDERLEIVKSAFKSYPDFPLPGIVFQDIFGVFSNPAALEALFSLAKEFAVSIKDNVDIVVGLDSRGFLLGPIMANAINKPFVPIRKKGKLPGDCASVDYSLEYGQDRIEIQKASVQKADRVLIVDDLLATGGTMSAAVNLIRNCCGEVVTCWVVVELTELQGRSKIDAKVDSLITM